MSILTQLQHIPVETSHAWKYVVFLLFITGAVYTRFSSQESRSTIRTLTGISVLFSWKFFTKRHEFLWNHFKRTMGFHFRFKILQHTVVAVRGETARKAFFDARSLDLPEGYKIFHGSSPNLEHIDVDLCGDQENVLAWFNKQLHSAIVNRNFLSDMIPTLLSDIERHSGQWGSEGSFDPFKGFPDLVFRLTIRMSTCRELAEDDDAINKIQALYWTIEKSYTAQALLLPWFPSQSRKNRVNATTDLFLKLYQIVELKRASASQSSDPVDVLISEGQSTEMIAGFILQAIHVSVINSGANASWSMVYLGMHPEWKSKVKDEVDTLLAKHTANSTDPLHVRLATIPISDWEGCMPALDAVMRETIRLTLTGIALRRNLSGQMHVADATVKKGDFVLYSLADVHLDPEIYRNPHTFDPLRFGPERKEDKKGIYTYLGWGAGRHPCTGMKVAQLTLKLLVAYMLTGYDYDMVDEGGVPLRSVPVPDRNYTHQILNVGEPVLMNFRKKDM